MKKLFAVALVIVTVFFALTACSDPVADEFADFLNVKMVQANANYEAMSVEISNWEGYVTDEEFITSLKEILIPKCEENISLVSAIALETEEVKAVKEKFIRVMETFRQALGDLLTGFENADEASLTQGNDKINQSIDLLSDYNASISTLAESKGMQVEY